MWLLKTKTKTKTGTPKYGEAKEEGKAYFCSESKHLEALNVSDTGK